MTKKARDLKRGDVTVLGKVLDPQGVFRTIGGVQKLAILCEGGRWFSCDSGDDLVMVEAPRVKARDMTKGQTVKLPGRPSPTQVCQIAGEVEDDWFLITGYRDGMTPDWIRARGDQEFEVVE